MFHKILIANRGEIAIRIIRTCLEMGVKTVAVYSAADRDALHVRLADEAVAIGPAPAHDSYLNMAALITAAKKTGAEAIHPGYGFLAENADFAELCAENGITFIGPSPEAIRKMGDKDNAKRTMSIAGVPVVPGSDGLVTSVDEAVETAKRIGYPVLVKASAGGGGKGMKEAKDEDELRKVFPEARQEAAAAFGCGDVYMERLIIGPRHIEVQIAADNFGSVLTLGDRDCSIQRRHQKLLEEAPAQGISDMLRLRMKKAAIRAAETVGYSGVGTVEFLVDHNAFYFLEMNTRIQVEHPITERVTGVDIVALQLIAAAGEPLPIWQHDITVHGAAIECRINAEDPNEGFRPTPGRVKFCHFPNGLGVRVDSAMYSGMVIPPYYDSLLAKVIAWGATRDEAIIRMKRALRELIVEGVTTTADFQRGLIENPLFKKGGYDTSFLSKISNLD
ncbi:MAG: acetyl-CoA carboxylase biotin carboxylase subunit [Selenomonadaceae bacterium]